MPADFIPILILLIVAAGMSAIAITLSAFLGPRKRNPSKDMPYESGMAPIGDARLRFSVKYYVIAILFILFDIESIFLYPWAVYWRQQRLFGFVELLVFLAILAVGYFYAWRKGALEWD